MTNWSPVSPRLKNCRFIVHAQKKKKKKKKRGMVKETSKHFHRSLIFRELHHTKKNQKQKLLALKWKQRHRHREEANGCQVGKRGWDELGDGD